MLKLRYFGPYTLLVISVIFLQFSFDPKTFVKTTLHNFDYIFTDLTVFRINNYDEIDYSVYSDEMVCEQISLIKFYPELSDFIYEAKFRGIKCNNFDISKLYFNASLF